MKENLIIFTAIKKRKTKDRPKMNKRKMDYIAKNRVK